MSAPTPLTPLNNNTTPKTKGTLHATEITPARRLEHPFRFKIKTRAITDKAATTKTKPQQPPLRSLTALALDARCLRHGVQHLGVFSQERPDRLTAIWKRLCAHGLQDACTMLESELVSIDDMQLTHTVEHMHTLVSTHESIVSTATAKTMEYMDSFNDTYMCGDSLMATRAAVGCLLNLASKVIDRHQRNGFALIRPPGHHACASRASGFCLVNNVAVVTKILQQRKLAKRVAIVDFDVHHGDGTQRIFYNDPNVLFISIHRYDGKFFPRTGSVKEMGAGKGEGMNVNIPLRKGAGDYEYTRVLHHIVLPILKVYNADVTIASAGFDAAAGDPLGGMAVTPGGYAILTRQLMSACKGKLIMSLEGGYECDVISACVVECVRSLMRDGHDLGATPQLQPNQRHFRPYLEQLRRHHSGYWRSLSTTVAKKKKTTTKPVGPRPSRDDDDDENNMTTMFKRMVV